MQHYEKIKQVKDQYTDELMQKANVIGVGIGFAIQGGSRTDQLAIVVMVKQKLPRTKLKEKDVIPREIEGVPVDVQSVGEVRALD